MTPNSQMELARWLDSQADMGTCSVLDLGCGTLSWIVHCEAVTEGRISYWGIDRRPALVEHHRRVFPWFRGQAQDVEELVGFPANIVIVNDLPARLCNGRAGQLLMNLSRSPGWRRALVISDPQASNAQRQRPPEGRAVPYNVEASGLLRGVPVERFLTYGGEALVYDREYLGADERVKLPAELRLVVASCGEDLAWLEHVAGDVEISDASASLSGPNVVRVPNGGREAGQYVRHILRTWPYFPSWTAFVQGHPFDHSPDLLQRLAAARWPDTKRVVFLSRVVQFRGPNADGHGCAAMELAQRLFGMVPECEWTVGAQFVVSASAILSRPRSFWEALLSEIERRDDGAWAIEPLWGAIFSELPLPCHYVATTLPLNGNVST